MTKSQANTCVSSENFSSISSPDEIPQWMESQELYTPTHDRELFLFKTSKSVMRLLSRFKNDSLTSGTYSPEVLLVCTFILIIFTVISHNIVFPALVISTSIIRTAFFDGEHIKHIFSSCFAGIMFSFFFMIPAFFMGYTTTAILIICKTFSTIFVMSLFINSCSFNKLTHSLRIFHIPSFFILLLDITIRFIHILGNISMNMITSLKLRSIGVNKSKQTALSGIIGTAYLKSMAIAKETNDAMICRCFDGEYNLKHPVHFGLRDAIILIYTILMLAIAIYFRRNF